MKTSQLFNEYKKYVLTVANKQLPTYYSSKYSYEYYLTQFDIVLNNAIKCELLSVKDSSKYNGHSL